MPKKKDNGVIETPDNHIEITFEGEIKTEPSDTHFPDKVGDLTIVIEDDSPTDEQKELLDEVGVIPFDDISTVPELDYKEFHVGDFVIKYNTRHLGYKMYELRYPEGYDIDRYSLHIRTKFYRHLALELGHDRLITRRPTSDRNLNYSGYDVCIFD